MIGCPSCVSMGTFFLADRSANPSRPVIMPPIYIVRVSQGKAAVSAGPMEDKTMALACPQKKKKNPPKKARQKKKKKKEIKHTQNNLLQQKKPRLYSRSLCLLPPLYSVAAGALLRPDVP